ncbi:DUF4097 family beta strand repeat-containing protein [Streptomyces olivoreticuli]|uniref:DUF4097 family beta strand repeat-containing protein n=1 Tax=Streptomyces olivoreticuli TaxID=68246 RepID=UPI000E25462E|nr:DUF4097 family beta strand repeat-containing protein [Streptomyces olivoreticuli]
MPAQSKWSLSTPRKVTFEEPVTALAVRIIGGTVNVVGDATGPARLELSEIDGPPLIVTLDGGTLTVAYDDLPWRKWLSRGIWGRTATVTLTVPTGTDVEVGVAGASAVVSNVTGRTAVRGVSGDVTLVGITGPVQAETVSGRLEAQGIGGDLHFKSVSGDLTLVESSGGTVRADSISGNVVVDLSPAAPGPSLALGTVSGDVAIRLPNTADAEVDANTTSGALSCGFEELHVSSQFGAKRITGRLGAGRGSLKVTSVSGAVALLRRPETDDWTRADPTDSTPQGKVL